MQITVSHVDHAETYRERLSPSLWVLAAAGGAAPMVALVFAPVDTTLALVAGALVGVAVIALLVLASPVLEVAEGELRAGRAHIEVSLLGAPQVLAGEPARLARGQDLDPRCWHVIRGGIDGIVSIPVLDPVDPAPAWVLSSRTPDRLAAAVRRAQVRRSTPSR
ncbi:DUF3093 domain-containing protein [Microbacterium thalassium]|uniref:DUF3093 domain-containing protein n=1 Tax=Microbacterium thalassium TaxID=362649 RepID=A0A7X0KV90_9MICO|nr:DUF3093 domain-containing protein [Microbacterium thalassium]MBB6391938.1 hypothetical protein [Microbacterium thalassium]GLK23958.1 hypothetical protein GCM10017607_12760 [Microbacterium thalassium]